MEMIKTNGLECPSCGFDLERRWKMEETEKEIEEEEEEETDDETEEETELVNPNPEIKRGLRFG